MSNNQYFFQDRIKKILSSYYIQEIFKFILKPHERFSLTPLYSGRSNMNLSVYNIFLFKFYILLGNHVSDKIFDANKPYKTNTYQVRRYFGEKIAIYFEFVNVYTKSMIPMILLGFIFGIMSLEHKY